MSSMRRLTVFDAEGPRTAAKASPSAPTPPIRMIHKSICAYASQSRRPAHCRAVRNCIRLSGFLFRLLQHRLEIVDQRPGSDRFLLGRDALLAGMAENHARQGVERSGNLAACDFRERLAEL